MRASEVAKRVRSILFVELLGGFGDLLLALPAIQALGRSHPGARVTVLTFAPGAALLAADPHVAEVVVAEPGPPEQQARAVARLVRRGFDLVVSDTRYGGIPGVLGADPRALVVDDLWGGPPPDERVDLRFLHLLADAGVIDPALRALAPRVALTAAERTAGRARLAALLPGGRPAALLVVEAGMEVKEWAPARFRALAKRLVGRGMAVLAAAGDRPGHAERIVAGLPSAAVLARGSLRDLAAVAAACAVCVSGDTGPGRLATAVGTPAVGLYGPTWAGRFGLRAEHASLQAPLACHVRDPADQTRQSCWYSGVCVFDDLRTCTDALTVDAVDDAVRPVLAARAGQRVSTSAEARPPASWA